MRLQVLGSGTTSWDMGRACSSYLLEVADTRLLLDCGPGAMLRMAEAGVDPLSIDALALSHTQHPDHAGDVAALLFAQNYARREPRASPLRVLGPAGTAAFLRQLRAAFPALEPRGWELRVEELGDERCTIADLELQAATVSHGEVPALGFRVRRPGEAGGASYSGDTGPCAAVVELCREAELALVECSYAEGEGFEIPSHLSARQVGALAAEAGVRHLVITHRYAIGSREAMEMQIRERYAGPLSIAEDLARFELSPPPNS